MFKKILDYINTLALSLEIGSGTKLFITFLS